MNPFEFVLVIMFMTFAFSLIRHRLGMPDRSRIRGVWQQPQEDSDENLRLRQEVSELKERIKVLERITVEKEDSLSRQIEELRDR
jgi:hypothetical protein